MKILLLVSTTLFFVSCATQYRPYAREVKKKPGEFGVVALKPEHRDEDRQYADQLMTRNCGDKKVLVSEEGEVEVGKTTSTNASKTTEKNAGFGIGFKGIPLLGSGPSDEENINKTSVETAIKEWHVIYSCDKNTKI